ncbi:hypothetical protein BKA67DRAFT_583453 [Truncatella angustata]|uniref:Transmembrane protein n=1 Tax=Truncatella angustata TaxID=152316 RepID=A0A9P8UCG1_9PEZI|nr:uncharacterized protein BKA67DRAFT_583453 [Truncatella angustata]KAH6646175.1 hypothetical protein BKA67DRAFT_583453 [Truncatella angustata]
MHIHQPSMSNVRRCLSIRRTSTLYSPLERHAIPEVFQVPQSASRHGTFIFVLFIISCLFSLLKSAVDQDFSCKRGGGDGVVLPAGYGLFYCGMFLRLYQLMWTEALGLLLSLVRFSDGVSICYGGFIVNTPFCT